MGYNVNVNITLLLFRLTISFSIVFVLWYIFSESKNAYTNANNIYQIMFNKYLFFCYTQLLKKMLADLFLQSKKNSYCKLTNLQFSHLSNVFKK